MDEKVVSLQEYREAQEPHLSGPARCPSCQHTWTAVAPVGTVSGLECPSCHRNTGYMEAEVVPKERWMCQCGCDIFRLSPTSILCVSCGKPVEGYP